MGLTLGRQRWEEMERGLEVTHAWVAEGNGRMKARER